MDEYGSPEEICINSTLIIIFLTYIRSVYKELHADRETGC